MKLLVVVSSLDLTQPFSATPAWWQLLKALYEIGVEIVAAPYQGKPIEALWWRQAANPARWQGDLFKWLRDTARRALPMRPTPPTDDESGFDWLVRRTAQALIAPSLGAPSRPHPDAAARHRRAAVPHCAAEPPARCALRAVR
jgi:hypothetical protein